MKQNTTPPTDDIVSNEFANFLNQHRRGQAANEAGASLREAIVASLDTGKKATLTIKVVVEPKGDDQVQMTVDVATKLPKAPIPPSMFWVEDGTLKKSDPKQPELPLREVNIARPVREAETKAANE